MIINFKIIKLNIPYDLMQQTIKIIIFMPIIIILIMKVFIKFKILMDNKLI